MSLQEQVLCVISFQIFCMDNFIVYKSSAGSGKTFTLVKEYLSLVLVQPSLFRHVLAITFTNKAANEMKQRILTSLKEMAEFEKYENSNAVKFLLPVIIQETGLSKEDVKSNCKKVLELILHNYSDFGVSTIDSFVHKIIRSFAFDLHLPMNFEVELNTDELLSKVIDLLLNQVGSNDILTKLLVEFVQTRAEEDKNWNVENDLFNVSKSLLKEDSQVFIGKLKDLQLNDFIKINRDLIKFIRNFEKALSKFGEDAIQIIESRGIPIESFYYGNRGIVSYFMRFANNRFDSILPNTYSLKTIEEDKWFSGKASDQDKNDINEIKFDLIVIYNQITQLIINQHEKYNTYSEIIKNLYPVAILSTIEKLMTEYKAENSIVLISEFNKRISEVVLAEPVPFIYERVGEKYQHFLVDEFQDTSILQWQNLLPLIDNSLAAANKNLIVGDGKQAIYRWRNGEVEQFAHLPKVFNRGEDAVSEQREDALIRNYLEKQLNSNFRSKPEIIAFNNGLFSFLKSYLPDDLSQIYNGVEQKYLESKEGGYVNIDFYNKDLSDDNFAEYNINRIKDIISDVCNNGYLYEDIAILCRSNTHASQIAGSLLKDDIQVISSESLLINNSPEVRFLVANFKLLVNENDQLAKTEIVRWLLDTNRIAGNLDEKLNSFFISQSSIEQNDLDTGFWNSLNAEGFNISRVKLLSLPVYEICEELIRTFNLNSKSNPYLQFFLDVIIEHSTKPEFDLAEMVLLWDQKKDKFSIVVPEGINAVKVMTIHKSKGLEFPVVIYPYAKELHKAHGEQLWVEFNDDSYPQFSTTLITTSKRIEETQFKEVYETEKSKALLDLLNVMYVVLTRPTDRLYIIAGEPPSGKSTSISVPFLLRAYLKNIERWEEGVHEYEFGSETINEKTRKTSTGNYTMDQFISNAWREKIYLSLQAPDYWETESPVAKQDLGKLIHKIFSEIISIKDKDGVVEKYFQDGIITSDEKKRLEKSLDKLFADPQINMLFRSGPVVKPESEILLPNGTTFRPDRVNFERDKTEVIDFKTGKESKSHHKQIKTYMDILKEMGHKNVKGYLLYINETKVVEMI